MSTQQTRFETAINDWVEDHRSVGIDLLRDLIATPSYSGKEGSGSDSRTVPGKLTKAISGRGTEIAAQEVRPKSENVIETLRGEGGQAFVLEAHTDVVPEGNRNLWFGQDAFAAADGTVEYLGDQRIRLHCGGQTHEAMIRDRMDRVWKKRAENERRVIVGRGSFDNKGAVASLVLAMGALADVMSAHGASLAGQVIAAYTVDEEDSGSGVRAFASGPDSWLGRSGYLTGPSSPEGMLDHISGISLEGSYGWCPVVGHRGAVQLKITTHGRSAHAATPHLGVNAVEQMARLLLTLQEGADVIVGELLQTLDPALLGPPTLAIGTTVVGGGVRSVTMGADGPVVDRSGVNTVPNWSESTVDVRYPPALKLTQEATAHHVLATIRGYLERKVQPDGWTYTVELLDGSFTPAVGIARSLADAASVPLVRQARARAAQILGYVPDIETAPGGTDATFMVHEGRIPTLVEFGPAGGLSHDVNEFVEADDVIAGAKILALLALDVLGTR